MVHHTEVNWKCHPKNTVVQLSIFTPTLGALIGTL